jgi:hypothetical protein
MACDYVLRDGVPDRDLDPEHFAPRARLRILVAKSTRGMPHSGPPSQATFSSRHRVRNPIFSCCVRRG